MLMPTEIDKRIILSCGLHHDFDEVIVVLLKYFILFLQCVLYILLVVNWLKVDPCLLDLDPHVKVFKNDFDFLFVPCYSFDLMLGELVAFEALKLNQSILKLSDGRLRVLNDIYFSVLVFCCCKSYLFDIFICLIYC